MAVDLGSITASVLRFPYPNAKVFEQGFEETALPNDYFDPTKENVDAVVLDRLSEISRHRDSPLLDIYAAASISTALPR